MLPLALFAVSLAIFHVSEFLMVAKYNRALLSVDCECGKFNLIPL